MRWQLIENRAMLLLNAGFVQTDLWDGDRSAAVARNARVGDFAAEAANQCADDRQRTPASRGSPGLAHVLDAPRGAYTVTSLPKAPELKSTGQCAWFRLEVAEPVRTLNDVCWSAQWGLPLEIKSTDANGDSATARFSVERVNEFQPTDAIFDIGEEPLNIDARADGDVSD
jgi:hypothetical protein